MTRALALLLGVAASPTAYKEFVGYCATAQDAKITYGEESAGQMSREDCETKCDQMPSCKAFQFSAATDDVVAECFVDTSDMVTKGEGSVGARCFVKPAKGAKEDPTMWTTSSGRKVFFAADSANRECTDAQKIFVHQKVLELKTGADNAIQMCADECENFVYTEPPKAAAPAVAAAQAAAAAPAAAPAPAPAAPAPAPAAPAPAPAAPAAAAPAAPAPVKAVPKCVGFELKSITPAVANADTQGMQCALWSAPCKLLAADANNGVQGQYSLEVLPPKSYKMHIAAGAALGLLLLAAACMMMQPKKGGAAAKRGVGKKAPVEEALPLYAPNMFTQQQMMPQQAVPMQGYAMYR